MCRLFSVGFPHGVAVAIIFHNKGTIDIEAGLLLYTITAAVRFTKCIQNSTVIAEDVARIVIERWRIKRKKSAHKTFLC